MRLKLYIIKPPAIKRIDIKIVENTMKEAKRKDIPIKVADIISYCLYIIKIKR